MKTLRTTFIVLSIVALALLIAPVASAGSVTYYGTIGSSLTDFSGSTGTVQQFDPSLGMLTSVQISLAGSGTTVLTVTNNNISSPTNFSALFTDLTLTLTDPGDADVDTIQAMYGGPTIPGGGLIVVNGTPYNSGIDTMGGAPGSQLLTSNLGSFIGLGNVTFDLAGAAITTESFSGGNFTAGQTTNAGGEVTVTYDYTQSGIPEPGTLSLFGTGLLGLAGMLRRKFAK
jgi:hypothetical protein